MNVAFLGTGLMGLPMARRVLAAGHRLVVYNRTQPRAAALQASGAAFASSPAQALEESQVAVLMLSDAAAIEAVLFGSRPQPAFGGRTIVQMGTISPEQSRAFAGRIEQAGGDYLEAPVLGSTPQAEAGSLQVMVGATPERFERWRGLLECFGTAPMLVGPVGQAAALKLALNQLIASMTAAFALSLGFVERQGVPVSRFMELLRQSALHAATFDKKLPRMVSRDFSAPTFPAKHLVKDVALFLDAARGQELDTSPLESVLFVLRSTVAAGLGDSDYSSLYEAICPERKR